MEHGNKQQAGVGHRKLNAMVGSAWTPSTREEVISVLWLIAGLQAWDCGFKTFAVLLFIKAAHDTGCSIICAIAETLRERDSANVTGEFRASNPVHGADSETEK